MSDRDRLAALLHKVMTGHDGPGDDRPELWLACTDRLIAAGVGFTDSLPVDMGDYMAGHRQGMADAIDVERLARALDLSGIGLAEGGRPASDWAAAIAAAYREAEG